jgi:hypothetical protein
VWLRLFLSESSLAESKFFELPCLMLSKIDVGCLPADLSPSGTVDEPLACQPKRSKLDLKATLGEI